MRIWKYELSGPHIALEMPKGAKILSLQTQFNKPCFWALVDVNAEKEMRYFVSAATGQEFGEVRGEYIGTFQIEGGALVFHVFEVKE